MYKRNRKKKDAGPILIDQAWNKYIQLSSEEKRKLKWCRYCGRILPRKYFYHKYSRCKDCGGYTEDDIQKMKLCDSMASAMCASLKGRKRGRHWENLVGYTLDDLIKHLESLFQYGMSWRNYGRGGWEVDHIIPLCRWEFTSPDDIDFQRCWALSNLRPLWGSENRSKGGRYTGVFQLSLPLHPCRKSS